MLVCKQKTIKYMWNKYSVGKKTKELHLKKVVILLTDTITNTVMGNYITPFCEGNQYSNRTVTVTVTVTDK